MLSCPSPPPHSGTSPGDRFSLLESYAESSGCGERARPRRRYSALKALPFHGMMPPSRSILRAEAVHGDLSFLPPRG